MFDLQQQAEAIIEKLESELEIGTVAFIEEDDESARYPCTLPAAFVAMEKLSDSKKRGQNLYPEAVWTIIVRAKKLNGPGGCLPTIDMVIDAIHGLRTGDNAKPLSFVEVEYFNKQAESVAYVIRFKAVNSGVSDSYSCTHGS